jgi:hypothetical protein
MPGDLPAEAPAAGVRTLLPVGGDALSSPVSQGTLRQPTAGRRAACIAYSSPTHVRGVGAPSRSSAC